MRFITIALVLTSLILAGCSGSASSVKGTVLRTDCGYRSTVLLEHEDGWATNYVVDSSDCGAMLLGDKVWIGEPVLVKDWLKGPGHMNESKDVSINRKDRE